MTLKADSAAALARTIEEEIIPLLRTQKGFRDEITFLAPERLEAVAISLWDTKEDAEAYRGTDYPKVLNVLSKVVEGQPKVLTFEVSTTTFEKVGAKAASGR
jgi:heme-degrading monooxygenase HmoA